METERKRRGWVRPALLAALLVCILTGGFSASASASTTYELRGEWSYEVTCTCTFPVGGHTLPGKFIVSSMSLSSGAFSGEGTVAGMIPALISGTATGSALSLVFTIVTPEGNAVLTAEKGEVEESGEKMSASGTWATYGGPMAGTLSAQKLRSWEAIEAERQKIKEEEAQRKIKEEEAARQKAQEEEAKQKAKAEEEAKKAKENEQQAKAAQEKAAKEKSEGEAKAAAAGQAAKEAEQRERSDRPGRPASLSGKTFTVVGSRLLALGLSNPNDYSISGKITLASPPTTAKTGRGGKRKAGATLLAGASYTISANSAKTVKLELSKSAVAQLERHKTLQAVATITTSAVSGPPLTKTYRITLKLPAAKHK